MGLGVFLDSLRLGPTGFLFVLIFIGIGALAAGVGAAGAVARYLARESSIAFAVLLVLELALVFGVYAIVRPLLGRLVMTLPKYGSTHAVDVLRRCRRRHQRIAKGLRGCSIVPRVTPTRL